MTKMPIVVWSLGMLVACAPETAPDELVQTPGLPKLVVQRVTAIVKREAARLVHVRTEHEALLTTPEHPFATPRSGWIPAGGLVPGDRVVSARFGTVRVLSVQNEELARPQRVFNLTVDPSHAYVVGADQVLVHNRKCIDLAETAKELEEAEGKLEELQLTLLLSPEDEATLKPQIAEAKQQVAKLKQRLRKARDYQKRKAGTETEPNGSEPETAPDPEAPRKDALARTARFIEALEAAIAAIEGKTAGSARRLAELKRERGRLRRNLRTLNVLDRRKHGVAAEPQHERLLKRAEADYEARSRELEAARRDLSELPGEEPRSDAEKKSHAERRVALEKTIEDLQLEQHTSREILAWERQNAELAGRSPATEAERQKIAEEQRDLRAEIVKKRLEQRNREDFRKRRADPEAWAKRLRDGNEARRKRLRTDDYVADTERPRDTLELLEEELEARRQEAGSGSLDERAEYLRERIETIQALAELAAERERIQSALGTARAKRRELVGAGQDVTEIEQKIARLVQERSERKTRYVQLSLREKVLAKLDGTRWTDALDAVDEARLRELERELEGELAAGGSLPEERLREIVDELAETELIDAEFLDAIWREAEAEEAALPETVQESPSPDRTTAVETGLQALRNELARERRAVEGRDFQLANEHAFLSQTQGAPGSSHHAASVQRLAELQQQRIQLRIQWREGMRRRLDAARQELRTIQSVDRLRDAPTEAELARKIELLEHEVNNPSF